MKTIYEKYLNEKTQMFEYDDLEFETFDSLIQHKLNWCGCGMPDQAQRMIMKALRHINNLQLLVNENKLSWEEWNADSKLLFGYWEYVIYYILDEKGLTEHGSGVPGWLTDKGKELLEELEEFYS